LSGDTDSESGDTVDESGDTVDESGDTDSESGDTVDESTDPGDFPRQSVLELRERVVTDRPTGSISKLPIDQPPTGD